MELSSYTAPKGALVVVPAQPAELLIPISEVNMLP